MFVFLFECHKTLVHFQPLRLTYIPIAIVTRGLGFLLIGCIVLDRPIAGNHAVVVAVVALAVVVAVMEPFVAVLGFRARPDRSAPFPPARGCARARDRVEILEFPDESWNVRALARFPFPLVLARFFVRCCGLRLDRRGRKTASRTPVRTATDCCRFSIGRNSEVPFFCFGGLATARWKGGEASVRCQEPVPAAAFRGSLSFLGGRGFAIEFFLVDTAVLPFGVPGGSFFRIVDAVSFGTGGRGLADEFFLVQTAVLSFFVPAIDAFSFGAAGRVGGSIAAVGCQQPVPAAAPLSLETHSRVLAASAAAALVFRVRRSFGVVFGVAGSVSLLVPGLPFGFTAGRRGNGGVAAIRIQVPVPTASLLFRNPRSGPAVVVVRVRHSFAL